MEKARVNVVKAKDGWRVYMLADYVETFVAAPPELPFALDREALAKFGPGLIDMAKKLFSRGYIYEAFLRFNEDGTLSNYLGLGDSYDDKCQRLIQETEERVWRDVAASMIRAQKTSSDHFDKLERALWQLEGLLDLLGACDLNQAETVNWEHAADAMREFTDKIQEAYKGLHDEWQKTSADDLLAQIKGEASPTAAKQEGEASKEQDS